jgi:hypothetical protein
MLMSDAPNDWPVEQLSADDVSHLREVDVQVADQRSLSLVDLLLGWKQHVEKLESDLPLPSSDRSVWGAHDVIAAVSLRSFVQEGLADLESEIRQRVEQFVSGVDETFLSYTEVDELGLLEMIDGRSNPDRDWWWRRIPKVGPAREEINLYGGLEAR